MSAGKGPPAALLAAGKRCIALAAVEGGLPTDDPWGDRQESITDDELDGLLRRGLSFDSVPGTAFAYSNLGYALLGLAQTAASATSALMLLRAGGRTLRPVPRGDVFHVTGGRLAPDDGDPCVSAS